MFCNTFLGMSLKKWRLSLRNCGLAVCFDPHFFSAQLNCGPAGRPQGCIVKSQKTLGALVQAETRRAVNNKAVGEKLDYQIYQFCKDAKNVSKTHVTLLHTTRDQFWPNLAVIHRDKRKYFICFQSTLQYIALTSLHEVKGNTIFNFEIESPKNNNGSRLLSQKF